MPVADRVPPRSALVLTALILGAIVASINLGVANVALPSIGAALGASQDQLTSIGAGFALGLAASVLYLGAIGDRYGRKLLFVCGAVLTIPTSMLAAWAPSAEVLAVARVAGGFSAALLFPTTLSLIGALYAGRPQVKAIALWSGLGGGATVLGTVIAGALLEHFWWGSVFLIAVPLDVLALGLGLWVLPWHAGEESNPVDHVGGVLSVLGVGGLVVAIERSDMGLSATLLVCLAVGVAATALFFWRQGRAPYPLVSLPLAKARTFWVAFVAGAISFGSLIGGTFIGQQYLQNVLQYSTFDASMVVLPTAIMTAICGQLAGRVIGARGSRTSFLVGLAAIAGSFAVMLATWQAGAWLGWVLIAYALIGVGVGFAATPASRALMGSVPPRRTGMGSAFLDLTRDFGGAVIQALMGVILAGVYAASLTKVFNSLPPDQASQLGDQAAQQIVSSYESAAQVATQFPQPEAQQIIEAASKAFTEGKSAAISVGLVLTLGAVALVYALFPRKADEEAYYAQVAADSGSDATPAATG